MSYTVFNSMKISEDEKWSAVLDSQLENTRCKDSSKQEYWRKEKILESEGSVASRLGTRS